MRPCSTMLLALALVASACGDTVGGGSGVGSCGRGDVDLVQPDVLTIATGDPVFPPWFVEQDPTNQQGLEAAVAYALAEGLGFTADEVAWVRAAPEDVFAAGAKPYDFAIGQYLIDEEAENVEFSLPYYTVRFALVANPGSAVDGAETTEELAGLRLGVALDDDTLTYVDRVVQPAERPAFYDTTGAARQALDANAVDALVYEMPAAHFVTEVELPAAVIAAQLSRPDDPPGQYGLVFAPINPLLACVDAALVALREDGTLNALEEEWVLRGGSIRTLAPPPTPGDTTPPTTPPTGAPEE